MERASVSTSAQRPTPTRPSPSSVILTGETTDVIDIMRELLDDDGIRTLACAEPSELITALPFAPSGVAIIVLPCSIHGWPARLLEDLYWAPNITAKVVVATTTPTCPAVRAAQEAGWIDAVLALPDDLELLGPTVHQLVAIAGADEDVVHLNA